LMNSVQRHEPTSVTRPPRSSPRDAPPEDTAAKRASARLRAASSGAPVVSRARTLGAASAAPTPCAARAATSCPGVWASPPRSEATVKRVRPTSKRRSRPRTASGGRSVGRSVPVLRFEMTDMWGVLFWPVRPVYARYGDRLRFSSNIRRQSPV
jgi:hypothetical protein